MFWKLCLLSSGKDKCNTYYLPEYSCASSHWGWDIFGSLRRLKNSPQIIIMINTSPPRWACIHLPSPTYSYTFRALSGTKKYIHNPRHTYVPSHMHTDTHSSHCLRRICPDTVKMALEGSWSTVGFYTSCHWAPVQTGRRSMWLDFRVIKNVKGSPECHWALSSMCKILPAGTQVGMKPTTFHPLPPLASEAEPALGNIDVSAVVARKVPIRPPTHFALRAVVSHACCFPPWSVSFPEQSIGTLPSGPNQIVCTHSCGGDAVSGTSPLTSHYLTSPCCYGRRLALPVRAPPPWFH